MKNEIANEKDKLAEEPIVIADECGDSMWDAVLGQEVRACQIINAINNPATQINTIKTEQPVGSDNAK